MSYMEYHYCFTCYDSSLKILKIRHDKDKHQSSYPMDNLYLLKKSNSIEFSVFRFRFHYLTFRVRVLLKSILLSKRAFRILCTL